MPLNLTDLPPEVLANIGFHLCLPTYLRASPPGAVPSSSASSEQGLDLQGPSAAAAPGGEWVIPPLSLLTTCRSLHDNLAPRSNPDLYARVFRAVFDHAAVRRRVDAHTAGHLASATGAQTRTLGSERADSIGKGNGGADRGRKVRMRARHLTAELRSRVVALHGLKAALEGDMTKASIEMFWVIYLMLIENDGKNVLHLFGSGTPFQLARFLPVYVRSIMLPASREMTFPPDGVAQSLAVWIMWLSRQHCTELDTELDSISRRHVLRPYVFAAHTYNLFFAPWVINDLPTLGLSHRAAPRDAFEADLCPRQRGVEVAWFGRTIKLSRPVLAQAAILAFFGDRRRPGRWSGDIDELEDLDGDDDDDLAENGRASPDAMDVDDDMDAKDARKTPQLSTAAGYLLSSRLHDRDFARLLNCHDPTHGRGMPRRDWKGSWSGCWEGGFSFFDFDAFREVLLGQKRAIYEGPYGEQAQVWRLVETYVRPRRGAASSISMWTQGEVQAAPEMPQSDSGTAIIRHGMKTLGNGDDMFDEDNLGPYDVDSDSDEEALPSLVPPTSPTAHRLPLRGPSTNAGFPTDAPSTTRAGLASAQAEATTLRETLLQQVAAMEGYEIVPNDEIDAALADPDEEGGVELLLTGTGHSAWGRFILKGRVRAWDGMASLVKEYAVSIV